MNYVFLRQQATNRNQFCSVAAATASAAGAAARRPGAGFGGAAGDGGAKDGKLDGGFLTGALGAGDFLLSIDHDFLKLGFAVVADVFVNGHVVFPASKIPQKLLQRHLLLAPDAL
jgi:hypothetical protein